MDFTSIKDIILYLREIFMKHEMKKHPPLMLCFVVGCLIVLYLIDDLFGFSFYYSIDCQLEQLANIQKMADGDNSYALQSFLTSKEAEIISRKTYLGSLLTYISSDIRELSMSIGNNIHNINWYMFLHYVTSVGSLFILLIFSVIASLGTIFVKYGSRIGGFILGVFVSVTIFLLMVFIQWIYTEIPTMFGCRIFNYAFQLVIQISVIYCFIRWKHNLSKTK